jgi:hypothetical protein
VRDDLSREREIGDAIADAIEKVGTDGVVNVCPLQAVARASLGVSAFAVAEPVAELFEPVGLVFEHGEDRLAFSERQRQNCQLRVEGALDPFGELRIAYEVRELLDEFVSD